MFFLKKLNLVFLDFLNDSKNGLMFFIFGKTGGHIAEMILDYSRVINNMNLYLLVNE